MTGAEAQAPYTLRSLQQMLGLGRTVILNLVAAGFVVPHRGARNEYRFTFQDVVLLRTAHQLRQAQIAPRRLLRSLRQLRARLPQQLPMSGLRIRAVGSSVAVKDGAAQWDAQSGQMLLDLEVMAGGGDTPVAFLQHPVHGTTATEWYDHALAAEAADPAAAEAAYRHAITLDPGLADAHANLGALLCEQRRWAEAVVVFEAGLQACPGVPLLHFNRGIALEELGRGDEALAAYEACLRADAGFADAHFNAARLLEQGGDARRALQHYAAYRRLQRSPR